MAPLSRFDISGPELVEAHEEVTALFKKIGWGSFFKKFDGHHYQITRKFALNIQEDVARVGGFHVTVNKESIAQETNFPQMG